MFPLLYCVPLVLSVAAEREPLFPDFNWHWRIGALLRRSRNRLWFALRQILVHVLASLRVLLRFLPQKFGVFRVALLEHLEARLLQQIVFDLARGGAGIEQ